MDADEIKKIEEIFKRHIGEMSEDFQRKIAHQAGIITEDFQHKLYIVVEGHQMLSEKIDRVENKVNAVAADLSAHRKDTEAHGPVYRVKESGD